MGVVVLVGVFAEKEAFLAQKEGDVFVYGAVMRVIGVVAHVPSCKVGDLRHESALFIYERGGVTFFVVHEDRGYAVLASDFEVVCPESGGYVYQAGSFFGGNEVGGDDAPSVAFRDNVGKEGFVTQAYELASWEAAPYPIRKPACA